MIINIDGKPLNEMSNTVDELLTNINLLLPLMDQTNQVDMLIENIAQSYNESLISNSGKNTRGIITFDGFDTY